MGARFRPKTNALLNCLAARHDVEPLFADGFPITHQHHLDGIPNASPWWSGLIAVPRLSDRQRTADRHVWLESTAINILKESETSNNAEQRRRSTGIVSREGRDVSDTPGRAESIVKANLSVMRPPRSPKAVR